MSSYEYSQELGLQPGTHRQAGNMAVIEHLISRLRDKVGKIRVTWGQTEDVLDLSDRYGYEYPDRPVELPYISITINSERYMEPGIGRVMVDGDGTQTGFTKILHLYIDVWARKNIERELVGDHIIHCLTTSWKFFRSVGIRDLKHIGTQSRNYDQESAALYQRMVYQTSSRIWRKIIQIEVEYDLVTVPITDEDGGIIEKIIIDGDITDVAGSEFGFVIGGLTEMMIDRKFVLKEQLEGVELLW